MAKKKKKKITKKDIKKVVKDNDNFLRKKQAKHVKMVEKSVKELQANIIDSLSLLSRNKSGRIEGISFNLKNAQKIHRQIEVLFKDKFSKDTKKVIDDFDSILKQINISFGHLNEASRFTKIDKEVIETLKNGYWQNYLDLGNTSKDRIIQKVYNHTISGEKFSTLFSEIFVEMTGQVSKRGVPLSAYARTYANDFVMNFYQEVNLMKAEKAKMEYFLYIGNVMESTRDFCKKHVGRYYKKSTIQSWDKDRWQGKSGPPLTNRGGYNCRHNWQAIRPEWLEGEKKIEVQDWFEEQ